jgi:hypothetical protein
MRSHLVVPALALLAALDVGVVLAQQTASRVEARVVPGLAFQHGIFGDDHPKAIDAVAMSVGGHVLARRSERFAWVFEGTLHPNGLQNPHFDENVSSLHLQFGPEFGHRVHVRPTLGIALQSWSGTRSCGCVGMALAGGIAGGSEHAVGSRVHIIPELFARASMATGVLTSAVGVQVGVGWKR